MNTKTMRLPPRRFLKRKERDDGFINTVKPSITMTTTTAPPPITPSMLPKPPPPPSPNEPAKSNQFLAGYLAHEFLSNGTIFGQPFDQAPAVARAEIVAKEEEEEMEPSRGGGGEGGGVEPRKRKCERYVDISVLLKKREGAQVQGIVNPTQLAQFLQI